MLKALIRALLTAGALVALSGGAAYASPITHIVIVIQENRTVDNLFNGYPGMDTVNVAQTLAGPLALVQKGLATNYDIGHTYGDQLTACNPVGGNGPCQNNNFGGESMTCQPTCNNGQTQLAYVPQSQVQQYWDLCQNFECGSHVLQTQIGPSWPSHQYFIAGQAGHVSDGMGGIWGAINNMHPEAGGCNALGDLIQQINFAVAYGTAVPGNPVPPCYDYNTILDEMTSAGKTWRYYAANLNNYWVAPVGVNHLFNSVPAMANVITPNTQFITDVQGGTLANLTFVTPNGAYSDHSDIDGLFGPEWVSEVVNVVGLSSFWNSTAIFVVWDDWGGWYDHYIPTNQHPPGSPVNPGEYGFRVPLIAINPYPVSRGFIDTSEHDLQGSLLRFIEETFGISSLGEADSYSASDLSQFFNFAQSPQPFIPNPQKVCVCVPHSLPIPHLGKRDGNSAPLDSDFGSTVMAKVDGKMEPGPTVTRWQMTHAASAARPPEPDDEDGD